MSIIQLRVISSSQKTIWMIHGHQHPLSSFSFLSPLSACLASRLLAHVNIAMTCLMHRLAVCTVICSRTAWSISAAPDHSSYSLRRPYFQIAYNHLPWVHQYASRSDEMLIKSLSSLKRTWCVCSAWGSRSDADCSSSFRPSSSRPSSREQLGLSPASRASFSFSPSWSSGWFGAHRQPF